MGRALWLVVQARLGSHAGLQQRVYLRVDAINLAAGEGDKDRLGLADTVR